MTSRPSVGVGAILRHGDEILLVRRSSGHGPQTWSTPGGHLDYGETPEECGRRETLEETGLVAGPLELVGVTNDVFPEIERHFLTLWMAGHVKSRDASVRAAEEIDQVLWTGSQGMPTPLFRCFRNLLEGRTHMEFPAWLAPFAEAARAQA